jgi:hypothetical protein
VFHVTFAKNKQNKYKNWKLLAAEDGGTTLFTNGCSYLPVDRKQHSRHTVVKTTNFRRYLEFKLFEK